MRSPLVLGSGSPRRREILEALRIPHRVVVADVDERTTSREAAETYLGRIALAKWSAIEPRVGDETLTVVADTSVIVDGIILGKPKDRADARTLVARLSGREHEVWTRFLLGRPGRGVLHAETVKTQVVFRDLSEEELDDYAASGEGADKAGAYAIQGLGASLVARIEGSYSNVVGLPACELVVALRALGAWP